MWLVYFCILFWDAPVQRTGDMRQYNLYRYCDSVKVETRKELREIKKSKNIKITKIQRYDKHYRNATAK